MLKTDRDSRRFVLMRTTLLSTALVVPFVVLLLQQSSQTKLGLGLPTIASDLAAIWETSAVIVIIGVIACLAAIQAYTLPEVSS